MLLCLLRIDVSLVDSFLIEPTGEVTGTVEGNVIKQSIVLPLFPFTGDTPSLPVAFLSLVRCRPKPLRSCISDPLERAAKMGKAWAAIVSAVVNPCCNVIDLKG